MYQNNEFFDNRDRNDWRDRNDNQDQNDNRDRNDNQDQNDNRDRNDWRERNDWRDRNDCRERNNWDCRGCHSQWRFPSCNDQNNPGWLTVADPRSVLGETEFSQWPTLPSVENRCFWHNGCWCCWRWCEGRWILCCTRPSCNCCNCHRHNRGMFDDSFER